MCELTGIYGMLTTLTHLCNHYSLTEGMITLACDNIKALDTLSPTFLPHPRQANFDLVSAVVALRKALPITIIPEHVRGHQDTKSTGTLTRLEILNVRMDQLAKDYWWHVVQHTNGFPQAPCKVIEHEGWQLWQGGQKIVQPSAPHIYAATCSRPTQYWWRKEGHVTSEAYADTDWEVTAQTMRKLNTNKRLWVTKTASENCGVGTTLVQWNYQDDATCPRCGHAQETTHHVSTCSGQKAHRLFKHSVRNLNRKLKQMHTDPEIRYTLVRCLHLWRKGKPIDPTVFPRSLHCAVNSQNKIGWQDLVEGQLSKHWRRLQQSYLSRQRSRKSSRRWATELLPKLVTLGRKQWLHRNDYKHRLGKPRHKKYEELLTQQIIREYVLGKHSLLDYDKRKLDVSIVHLQRKPLRIRKAWWYNITMARQRAERKRRQDDKWQEQSRAKSTLYQFLKGAIR